MLAGCWCADRASLDGDQAAGWPSGGLRSLELPPHQSGPQARGADRGRLLGDPEARRRGAGLGLGGSASPARRRSAGQRGPGSVRRARRSVAPPVGLARHRQAELHRLDRRRQAPGQAGRRPLHPHHHGAGRPCPGAGVRRRRLRQGCRGAGHGQGPQCRTGMRLPHPLLCAAGHLRALREGLLRTVRRDPGGRRPEGRHAHGADGQPAPAADHGGHDQGRRGPRRPGGGRRRGHGRTRLVLAADRAGGPAARGPGHERGAVRAPGPDDAVQDLRRGDRTGQPPALRHWRPPPLHPERQDRDARGRRPAQRDGGHQHAFHLRRAGLAVRRPASATGHGAEDGPEGLEACLVTKAIHQA